MPEIDESTLSVNVRAVLIGLRRCTLSELQAIERCHFPRVKQEVAKRTGEACVAKVAAEFAPAGTSPADEVYDLDDRVTLGDAVPPECADVLGDDPGATAVIRVDPTAGVRAAWNEDASGPVS